MTALLDHALDVARSLPAAAQEDIARIILQLAGAEDDVAVAITPDQKTAIAGSKAAAARGEFATDEQVRAVWGKRGF